MSDYTFYHSNDSQNNHDNRGAKKMIFRTQGREDIFSFLFLAENQEQTGNHNQGNDTFGFQIYLCQTYESVDYCCISGILRV